MQKTILNYEPLVLCAFVAVSGGGLCVQHQGRVPTGGGRGVLLLLLLLLHVAALDYPSAGDADQDGAVAATLPNLIKNKALYIWEILIFPFDFYLLPRPSEAPRLLGQAEQDVQLDCDENGDHDGPGGVAAQVDGVVRGGDELGRRRGRVGVRSDGGRDGSCDGGRVGGHDGGRRLGGGVVHGQAK